MEMNEEKTERFRIGFLVGKKICQIKFERILLDVSSLVRNKMLVRCLMEKEVKHKKLTQ